MYAIRSYYDYRITRYGDIASAKIAGVQFKYKGTELISDKEGFVLRDCMKSLFILTRSPIWRVTDKARYEQFKRENSYNFV